jgi:hypothetical protein
MGVAMTRQYTCNMNGQQFLGNVNTREVHDLDNEDTADNGCQIDEIIRAGLCEPFSALSTAHIAGYDNCAKCIGNSRR